MFLISCFQFFFFRFLSNCSSWPLFSLSGHTDDTRAGSMMTLAQLLALFLGRTIRPHLLVSFCRSPYVGPQRAPNRAARLAPSFFPLGPLLLDCCAVAATAAPLQDRHLSYAERVEKRLDVRAVQSDSDDPNELLFDLVGIDASIANALRRILLAEVSIPCPIQY